MNFLLIFYSRDYIQNQFQAYLEYETLVDRQGKKVEDTRVHACLYFISPIGHGLKPLDLEVMLDLQDIVNIVPVIAKSDSFTSEELRKFKQNVFICILTIITDVLFRLETRLMRTTSRSTTSSIQMFHVIMQILIRKKT